MNQAENVTAAIKRYIKLNHLMHHPVNNAHNKNVPIRLTAY